MVQFRSSASYRPVVQFCDDHASNEAREGVELEEPGAPEGRDLWVGDGDAAEEDEGDDEEGI